MLSICSSQTSCFPDVKITVLFVRHVVLVENCDWLKFRRYESTRLPVYHLVIQAEYESNDFRNKTIANPDVDTFLIQSITDCHAAGGSRGGCRGCVPPPPKMKPSSNSLLKFVYHTSQLRHSLVMHPSLEQIWIGKLIN